jgi:hypothetical protein
MSDLIVVGELRLLGEFLEVPEPLFQQRVYQREPSRVSRSWKKGEAVWFDPANASRRVMPYTRIVVEYFKAVGSLTPGLGGKLKGYLAVLEFILMVMARMARRRCWMGWSVVSAALTRCAAVTSLPLRGWCLSAGLARRRSDLVRLALSDLGKRAPLRLMMFGTGRLTYRFDPYSVGLLLDWLVCSGQRRQLAAAVSVTGAINRYRTYFQLLRSEPGGPSFDELVAPIARSGLLEDSGLDAESRQRLRDYLDALEPRPG